MSNSSTVTVRSPLASQSYAAEVFRTTSFDGTVHGYGDIAGPWTVTTEFGAQAAAAGMPDANHVMRQLYPLQSADGSFPGGTDDWYGGDVPAWVTTMTGVAPTAWVYFAQNGDPLLQLCGISQAECVGDCKVDGVVTIDELIRGVNITLGNTSIADCPAFDANGDLTVTVDELLKAVSKALNGC